MLTPRKWVWDGPFLQAGWLDQGCADAPTVWEAQLPLAPEIESRLLALLSADERSRLGRLQLRADQQRFLAGRSLLRLLAGAHLRIPPERIEFGCGEHGKPFIRASKTCHFNISHSGELILLAFDNAREVGVDVEQMRMDADLEMVAKEILPGNEFNAWLGLEPEERCRKFFHEWTRRESAIKATGAGMVLRSDGPMGASLAWLELDLPPGYAGHVCSVA
jgi:4'-phosphopantetheinyl transferase